MVSAEKSPHKKKKTFVSVCSREKAGNNTHCSGVIIGMVESKLSLCHCLQEDKIKVTTYENGHLYCTVPHQLYLL